MDSRKKHGEGHDGENRAGGYDKSKFKRSTDNDRPKGVKVGSSNVPDRRKPDEPRERSNDREYRTDKPVRKDSNTRFDKDSRSDKDRPYSKPGGDKKPFSKSTGGKKTYGKPEGDKKPWAKSNDDRPARKFSGDKFAGKSEGDRSGSRKPQGDKPYGDKPYSDKPFKKYDSDRPAKKFTIDKRSDKPEGDRPERKPFDKAGPNRASRPEGDRTIRKPYDKAGADRAPRAEGDFKKYKKAKNKRAEELHSSDGTMRLNRFLAIAGISSRREADELIRTGLVMVNGKIVTEMGFRVKPNDDVRYNGERIKAEKKVYILLNKPKGYITTVEDEKARKTVMELINHHGPERFYPVGRLDRSTTGVLLFTNDGDLAKKLTHPSHGAKKIYHVVLDKNVSQGDLAKIAAGVELEDGIAQVDQVSFIGEKARNNVGIELHIGRNRIVRRIFEHLGYEVTKLDRVMFASLTKKQLNRGQWRYLTDQEVAFLQMM